MIKLNRYIAVMQFSTKRLFIYNLWFLNEGCPINEYLETNGFEKNDYEYLELSEDKIIISDYRVIDINDLKQIER